MCQRKTIVEQQNGRGRELKEVEKRDGESPGRKKQDHSRSKQETLQQEKVSRLVLIFILQLPILGVKRIKS